MIQHKYIAINLIIIKSLRQYALQRKFMKRHFTLSQISNQVGTPPFDPTEFRHLLRSLTYLTLTHPSIAFAVNHIAQFMARPTMTHLVAA